MAKWDGIAGQESYDISRLWRPNSRQAERYSVRDRSYGVWHRVQSIARFLGIKKAAALTMVDLDSVLFTECRWGDKTPLCLVEVAKDVGQEKQAPVMARLAQMADIPAYIALYRPAVHQNPYDSTWPDIDCFRVKRLWPHPEGRWRELSPQQWARALVRIRTWQLQRLEVKAAANDDSF